MTDSMLRSDTDGPDSDNIPPLALVTLPVVNIPK